MKIFWGIVPPTLLYQIMRISILFYVIMTLGFQLLASESNGQSMAKTTVAITLQEADLETVISEIERVSPFLFIYQLEDIRAVQGISLRTNKSAKPTVKEILEQALIGTDLNFSQVGNKILIKRNPNSVVFSAQEGQQINVHGQVIDSFGKPVSGVTVRAVGTNTAVVTDSEGKFSLLNVPQGTKLQFRMIGYEEEIVTASVQMLIKLRLEVGVIEEVLVNTGYQTIAKERTTGATVTIGQAELEKRNVINIMDNLEGRVPGLVRYNGNTSIRGIGTLTADKSILIVVDGFPLEGGIENINPNDVERITVLKDAAATAIYGARATNGVIVVETKNAKKTGKVQIEAAANLHITEKPDYSNYNYMTPFQQVESERLYADEWFNSGIKGSLQEMIGSFEREIETGVSITPVQYLYYQKAKGLITSEELQGKLNELNKGDFLKDYKKYALKNQVIQQYNLALRSGTDNTSSNLVLNYRSDNSGFINAYDRQLNIQYRGSYRPAKWVEASYGVNSILNYNRKHNNVLATDPFNVPSYYSLIDSEGLRTNYNLNDFNLYSSYNTLFEQQPKLFSMGFNHLDELEKDYNNSIMRNTRFFIDLALKPFEGLVIRPQFQYEDNRLENSIYSEEESYTMRRLINTFTLQNTNGSYTNLIPVAGRLRTGATNSPSYTARIQGNYDKSIGNHSVSVIAGSEFRQLRSYTRSSVLFGYDDQLQTQANSSLDYNAMRSVMAPFWGSKVYPSVLLGTEVNVFGTRDVLNRFASAYANMTYTYQRKYNVFGSIRKDYADLLGSDDRYRGRPLWSTGVSWNISNEDFFKDNKWFDQLKLRTSYGVTGNIAMNYTARMTATIAGTNLYSAQPIANVDNPPNDALRWEKTSTFNIGLDFATNNNRLRGTLDWYRKSGTDLLAIKRLDATQGFTQMMINNGDMINNGIEANISYDWFSSGNANNLSWTTTINMGHNRNRVTNVDEIVTNPLVLAGQGTLTVGNPVNSLYSYQFKGLDQNGVPLWTLSDGTVKNQIPSTDLNAVVYSGGTNPATSIGVNNEVNYKGIGLQVFVTYYGGHYLRNNPPMLYNNMIYGAAPNYLLDSWRPDYTDTDIPAYGVYFNTAANAHPMIFADKWVVRADVLKVRNIILNYRLPDPIGKRLSVSNLRLSFQVNNPNIQWTKSDLAIDAETQGLRIPTSYVLGLNFNF
ncbi:MAG: SusC/RagA family TonB-linked outer membrane protein [Sphingobacterium sp.]|jgi:TonB-linked SusC/RagA family outer membrane protein|nr:SusC/RagA family TonB-linked outer membrane protein [Sphingobacterium sp.]